jgi:hypothetical protein
MGRWTPLRAGNHRRRLILELVGQDCRGTIIPPFVILIRLETPAITSPAFVLASLERQDS